MPSHRVNVIFSDSAYRDLTDLAARRGKTMADVLRDAIALSAWWHEQANAGCRLLTEDRRGRVREVVPR